MRQFNCTAICTFQTKEQPFCFIKSSSSQFGFCPLENEHNFLSNQRAGNLMNVTRNRSLLNETTKINYQFLIKH